MQVHTHLSPISLSYVAALRGVKPRRPGDAFFYAACNVQQPETVIGLAASNPEGTFFVLTGDQEIADNARAVAQDRGVRNVTVLTGSLQEINRRLGAGEELLPPLHYLCCDESDVTLTASERAALFDLAAHHLLPGGLLGYGYQVAPTLKDVLKFLVREFAPEMNAQQALDMLIELKKLGTTLWQNDPALAAQLDNAIAKNMPDAFFTLFEEGVATSRTFDTMVALRPRSLAYAGDSHIPANYIELSVSPEAQEVVIKCRDNHLYECIKDLAIGRHVRTDIWCKQPAVFSQSPAELFGGFAYGILPHVKVPTAYEAKGKVIDLTTPLYAKLLGLMATMPIGIGDFMAHADGTGFEPGQIVEALTVLVACGLVHPMRGVREGLRVSSVAQPRFMGQFNQHLSQTILQGGRQVMASAVLGDVISISPRDALVMQALDRAGLANSISALLPELERLSTNPAVAAQVSDLTTPDEQSARRMIESVVTESIATWYAFGLLEAA